MSYFRKVTAFLQEIVVCVFCQSSENPTRTLTQNIQLILNGLTGMSDHVIT